MNQTTGVLVAIAVGVLLIATLILFIIPEPPERAIVATDRVDVAVLDFANSSSWPGVGETLRSRVESRLVNAAGISVYSRAQLDAILLEQALSSSGMIDPTTAIEIGQLTGANKLITGSVYAVNTRSEATTVCVEWANGQCVNEVPATTYAATVLAQVQVVDTRTGLIEQSLELSGTDATTVRSGTTFGGFDSLFANASADIADSLSYALTATYTRELRYGLYEQVKTKREGYVGSGQTTRFSSTDTAYLIVHFTRVAASDLFDVAWIAPDGTELVTQQDVVFDGSWRLYELDLSGLTAGRYRVSGTINGVSAFDDPFVIVP